MTLAQLSDDLDQLISDAETESHRRVEAVERFQEIIKAEERAYKAVYDLLGLAQRCRLRLAEEIVGTYPLIASSPPSLGSEHYDALEDESFDRMDDERTRQIAEQIMQIKNGSYDRSAAN
jgi:hypothetical protein